MARPRVPVFAPSAVVARVARRIVRCRRVRVSGARVGGKGLVRLPRVDRRPSDRAARKVVRCPRVRVSDARVRGKDLARPQVLAPARSARLRRVDRRPPGRAARRIVRCPRARVSDARARGKGLARPQVLAPARSAHEARVDQADPVDPVDRGAGGRVALADRVARKVARCPRARLRGAKARGMTSARIPPHRPLPRSELL